VQFLLVLLHSLVNVVATCSYPKLWSVSFVAYDLFMASLFLSFYARSYDKRKAD
jgi:hypothetical protein